MKTSVITTIMLLNSILLTTPVFAEQTQANPRSGYLKGSNSQLGHGFGILSISGDGQTIAVRSNDRSPAKGVYADQTGRKAPSSGAVHIYVKGPDLGWHHEAFIKSSNAEHYDGFGISVSLSYDGSWLAVGAEQESSNATGINGDQDNNKAYESGTVYLFFRNKQHKWRQTDYIKASNTEKKDHFGYAVSLNDDATVLAVGAKNEDSKSIGVDGDQLDNSVKGSGAVYVFKRTRSTWRQAAYVKAPVAKRIASFGQRVKLNGKGNLLLVGAPTFDSKKTYGKTFLYQQAKGKWGYIQELQYPAQVTLEFGIRVAISQSGDRLAIAASGACNTVAKHSGYASTGVVIIFNKQGKRWKTEAALQANDLEAGDCFGSGLAMNASGDKVLVGADKKDKGSLDLNFFDHIGSVGAAYLFARDKKGKWTQSQKFNPHNSQSGMLYGLHLDMDAAGDTAVVGAIYENSDAKGVGGDGFNHNASTSGAAYIYSRNSDNSWVQGIPTH